ncbi:MAG: tetratricopeptide repeat protein [Verrucomicrobiales bacterium]
MPKRKRAKPQKDCPDLIKARDSWGRGRFTEALRRFDKAVRRQPDHAGALSDAARAYGARFQVEKAKTIIARLERVTGQASDQLVEVAQIYDLCRRPDEAARCLHLTLAHHPDHADANYEMARLLEEQGDLTPAREHAERALHSAPESDRAKILHARLLSKLGDNDYAYAILIELSEPGVRPLVRGEALSMLAGIHESEGEFDEAFETMMASNAALERISTKARDEAEVLEPVLGQLRQSVEQAQLKKWARIQTDPELESPPLALMTAPYCSGANQVGELLSSQAGFAISNNVGVFSDEIFPAALLAGEDTGNSKTTELFNGLDHVRRRTEAQRYRELLIQCLPDNRARPDRLIDNSPSIVPLIPSFLRIVPDGKVIVPLRDPRDILVSSLFAHFEPERDTVALSHPFDATEKINFELGTWLHFREMLDPDQWQELRYEAVIENPTTAIADALEWLGSVEHRPALPPPADPPQSRWKHYESHLRPYFDELEPLLEPLGYA